MDPSRYFNAEARLKPEIIKAPQVPTVVVAQTDLSMDDMPRFMDGAFGALMAVLEENHIEPVGPAFSLHYRIPEETAELEVGFPVDKELFDEVLIGEDLRVVPSTLPAHSIATVSHIGSYGHLGDAWGEFMQWVEENGYSPTVPFWEFYVTEPTPEMDPETLRTDLYVPLET